MAARARVTSCGVRTNTPISLGAISVAEPGFDGLANCVGFRGDCVEGFDLGRRTVEDRDDPAPLVLQPIGVAQDRRQQLIGGAANLLRGAVADLERVRAAAHVDAEARPRKGMLKNALSHVARQEQAIRLCRRQGRKEPQFGGREVLGFVNDDMVERLGGRRASASAKPVKTFAQVV